MLVQVEAANATEQQDEAVNTAGQDGLPDTPWIAGQDGSPRFGEAEADLWTTIFVAGDLDRAAEAVAGGANINAQLPNFFGGYYCLEEGETWEAHPTWWGKAATRELLGSYTDWLEGTELEGEGLEGSSALHIACWLGEPEKVMFCLENGASTGTYSKYYGYPRDITSDTGLKELLDHWYDAIPDEPDGHVVVVESGEAEYSYEKLGDDYDQHPWVPPTFPRALKKKRANMFRHGEADIYHTRPTDMLLECGLGVTMYFSLLKWLAGLFLVLSVMTIPALVLNHAGSSIPSSKQDGLGISVLTLGNMQNGEQLNTAQQYDCDVLTATEFAQRQRGGIPCNQSSINVWGSDISEMHAGYLQSAMDFMQSVVFIGFCVFLRLKVKRMVRSAQKSRVVLEDYSVLVRNLPPDATAEDVIEHFNSLYPLVVANATTTPGEGVGKAMTGDWKGRTVEQGGGGNVTDPLPSRFFQNKSEGGDAAAESGGNGVGGEKGGVNEATRGKWVAEVVLVYRNSADIRAYLSMQSLIRKLRRARAQVKMYADDTPLDAGANTAKHAKAEKMTYCIGSMLDELAKRIQRLEKGKATAAGPLSSAEDPQDVVAAFVTFNEALSCARCLEDYKNSRSWLGRYFQHEKLRFRMRRGGVEDEKSVPLPLEVWPAPQPASVRWESMDTGWREKLMRRASTRFASVCMLILSFIMVLVAKQLKNRYELKVPDFDLCEEQVPSLFLRSYEKNSKFEWMMARQDIFGRTPLDTQCAKRGKWVELCDAGGVAVPSITIPTSVTSNETTTASSCTFGAVSSPTIYSIAACSDSLCPNPTLPTVCPCTNPKAFDQKCQTLPCFEGYEHLADVDRARVCETFPASTITACYCYKGLQQYMSEHGVFSGGRKMWAENNDLCEDLVWDWLSARSYATIAVFCVVVVNYALRTVLVLLVRQERHMDSNDEAWATTWQVFWSTFVNTGVITLMVNGDPNTPSVSVHEFDISWYSYVGVAITCTMVLEMIAPHAASLVTEFVSWWRMRRAQSRGAGVYVDGERKGTALHSFPNQRELDEFAAGEQFELQLRYPHILNGIFVTMLYSAGLPLLLPLLAMSILLTYWVEKYMLLRRCQRPQGGEDETLAMLSVQLLPFALVLHLATSVWIYGNSEVSTSNVINVHWISGKAGMDSDETAKAYDAWLTKSKEWDEIGLISKIVRNNTFPHFLLLVTILLVMIIAHSTLPVAAFLRRQFAKSFHGLIDLAEKHCSSCTGSEARFGNPISPSSAATERKTSNPSQTPPTIKGSSRVFVAAASENGSNASQRITKPVMLGQIKNGTTRGKKDKHSKFKLSSVRWASMIGGGTHMTTRNNQRSFTSFRQLFQESESKRCPSFTGVFQQRLPMKQRPKMSSDHQAAGWCLDSTVGGKMLCKKWTTDGVVNGVKHTKGHAKRTWEVLRDWNQSGCKSMLYCICTVVDGPAVTRYMSLHTCVDSYDFGSQRKYTDAVDARNEAIEQAIADTAVEQKMLKDDEPMSAPGKNAVLASVEARDRDLLLR
jgi:hypothetical protein